MELHAHLGLFVYTVQYLFVVFLFQSSCVAFYVYRTVKSRGGPSLLEGGEELAPLPEVESVFR